MFHACILILTTARLATSAWYGVSSKKVAHEPRCNAQGTNPQAQLTTKQQEDQPRDQPGR